MIVVQYIHTRWTKRSRGGSEATLRNAVPEAARLSRSLVNPSDMLLVCHRIFYDERDGFSVPGREDVIETPDVPFQIGCVKIGRASIASSVEQVYMKFEYNRQHGGAPDRSEIKKTQVLNVGKWGQIVYNGRFSTKEGGWWYEKTVVNVGLVVAPLTSNTLFTRSEPDERFLATGHLL